MEPGSGRGPVALYSRGRDPHHLRGFLQRKACKKTQLHYTALPRIDLSKGIEGIIERDDIDVFCAGVKATASSSASVQTPLPRLEARWRRGVVPPGSGA